MTAPFRMFSFVVHAAQLALVTSVGFALVGCATPRPQQLPPLLQGEADGDLMRRHHEANTAYTHCREAHEGHLPWHALTTSGLVLGGAAVVGGGAAVAVVFAQDPLLLPVGVGVAASSTAFFALAAQQALSIPDDFHRSRIRDAALVQARTETMAALDERDPAALERVKRNLYENCRVADIAIDGPSGDVLLRDYARYRREADAQRRWEKELKDKEAPVGKGVPVDDQSSDDDAAAAVAPAPPETQPTTRSTNQ